jgi:hypothetical protein
MATTQTFICREAPLGSIGGSNRNFSIANIPNPNTEQVFLNGVLQNAGSDNDYVLSGTTITFSIPPQSGDVILVNYFYNVISNTEDNSINTASLNGRTQLIHWCLRKLGAPVIEINLDDDQIEDRIDEALYYFRDYHFDGVERCYLSHRITASTLTLAQPFLSNLTKNDIIVGQTSGASGFVYDKSADGRTVRYMTKDKKFVKGETVVLERTGEDFILQDSDSAVFIGDIDNKSIPVGQKVISITNVLPQQRANIGGNLGGMFDFQYQFALHNMFNLASTDLVTYDIYQRYMSTWEFMFRGQKGIRFNRKTDKVELDLQDWVVDQWVVLEAWVALDPNQYTEVYSDEFVREYACALLKQQWGTNLKKYSGIQLPGGVQLNGQQIYEEATLEIERLREKVEKTFQLPPDFIMG